MSMRFITTWTFKPDEPFKLARSFSHLEGTVLLYSGGPFAYAQTSYLCLFPDEKITLTAQRGCWERLEKALGPFESTQALPKWVGYLSYEMGCFADRDIEMPCYHSSIPDACLYRPSAIIHFDHLTKQATLYAKKAITLEGYNGSYPASKLQVGFRSDTLQSYQEKIEQAKEWILDGEIYQVNLSQEFHLEGKSDPFQHFQNISRINPAPFSAYMRCQNVALVSSSPERFLSRKGDHMQTRPIKGTAPRGHTPEEDEVNRQTLLHSEKERAELLMITDLMRHELAKVSLPGSVQTRAMWQCEAYTNVFHLLSIIESQAQGSPISLIRQVFPGGSITGCPKLRAMEAISALEKRPRGAYTGSIGYFAVNGDFDFNIAIRTLIVHPTYVQIQLGGAIGIDSDPTKEFEETLHKGKSLFTIMGAHELCLL